MTKQEQELLQALLHWDNAEAPEAALLLVKGIDQQFHRFYKKLLDHALERYQGNRNNENRIELDSFIPYLREECRFARVDLPEFLTMLALYHFHPHQDEIYLEFNEPLGAFEPKHAEERMQELLRGCSIIEGKPQLSNWYDGYSKTNSISFFVQLISECPEDLHVDESLQRSNITTLDLRENELSVLPCNIGNLISLEHFFLSFNQFDELPPTIGNLTSLQCLHLSCNHLIELPSTIEHLISLEELDLNNNQLRVLPSTIGNLTSLKNLYLSSNQFSELPSTIGNLTSLKQLYLGENHISELPSNMRNLTSLEHLDLDENHLSEFPSIILKLTSLTRLYLTENQISKLPVRIGNLSSLEYLSLADNHLNELPITIRNLTSLILLDLSGNQFSSEQKKQIQSQFPFAYV